MELPEPRKKKKFLPKMFFPPKEKISCTSIPYTSTLFLIPK